jgi:molybdopterin converting factor small subunit
MKVTLKFAGMMQKFVGWKKEIILELPEGATLETALAEVGIEWGQTKGFGFAMIDKKVIKDKDYVMSPGDTAKLFARSYGG